MQTDRRRFMAGWLGMMAPGFGVVAARLGPPVQAMPQAATTFTPLPLAGAGDYITAEKWNALVEAINAIGRRDER